MPSLVRKRSYGSVTVFWLDRDAVARVLRERAEALVRHAPEVQKVVLFGSLAARRAIPGSDADILPVIRGEAGPFLERVRHYQPFLEGGMPVDLFCYTEGEIQRIPLARTALREGVVRAQKHNAGAEGAPLCGK
ncbi:MAG: nucleotidyltransferase domain-containing protein [Dehalococcoidia bacterium]|nr:nucleotidyltransferase domain-containing protein [Dehalococcoidia bacterium]MDW8120567.1 nucleotidyltransferase domain-containing protein [Chloroflexota bacterium]